MAEKLLTKIKWQIQIKPRSPEQAYEELKAICAKFQDESRATDMELKPLLREPARA